MRSVCLLRVLPIAAAVRLQRLQARGGRRQAAAIPWTRLAQLVALQGAAKLYALFFKWKFEGQDAKDAILASPQMGAPQCSPRRADQQFTHFHRYRGAASAAPQRLQSRDPVQTQPCHSLGAPVRARHTAAMSAIALAALQPQCGRRRPPPASTAAAATRRVPRQPQTGQHTDWARACTRRLAGEGVIVRLLCSLLRGP